EGNARSLFTRAMQRGALGVIAPQKLPAFNQQSKNVNSIQFSGVARDTVNKGFLIYLSAAARDSIKAALAAGAVEVQAVVKAVFDVAPERTIVAEIRGAVRPTERFVYSAHVQEPGANDNASGVGLLAEMARTAAVLVKGGRVNPARTMTFLWGDEIRATARYLSEDSTRRAGVKWGMSLDMVGENTALTGGSFLIEKMKDPSAVWVRGEDQHTEWGSSPVRQADIWPHFLNDFSRQRCLDRAATTGWVVKANPFEGGSDHTPFLSNKIPAVLFWHFTDQYYHTDRDRIEMVSATTLGHVGNCALTTGFLLTAGTDAVGGAALKELVDVAAQELRTQAALSRAVVAKGGDAAAERKIVEAWRDYYVAALPTVQELAVGGTGLAAQVAAGQARVRAVADEVLATLK
ncbi:MAG: M28 family peptidase, partial [Gemmatimonadales bacterium]|nr:M28 family peptidase [Gemmatimonadales bacterium]